MELILKRKEKNFVNKNNEVVTYNHYFVTLSNGVEIQLKPVDNTAKQLLDLEKIK